MTRKEEKSKDYAFWRQFDEKPSTLSGLPRDSEVSRLH